MSDEQRTPAHAPDSERAILGSLMWQPDTLKIARQLRPEDFYLPAHEELYSTILALSQNGDPFGPSEVLSALDPDQLRRIGGGPYLQELSEAAVPAAIEYHVRIVLDRSHIRALQNLADTFREQAYRATANGPALQEWGERRLSSVAQRTEADDLSSMLTLDEFLAHEFPQQDYVVPGLLGREERLILTGGEGAGKTELIRQFAVCAAAGLEPFGRPVHGRPSKVLVVDLENPPRIVQSRFRRLARAAEEVTRKPIAGSLFMELRPNGMDVSDPRDRSWLLRRIEAVRPDLLVIGPAYKMYNGGRADREEDLARMVVRTLDEARSVSGSALILEHHTPHANPQSKVRSVRPIGSSLWLRWPEFGYGLEHDPRSTPGRRVVRFRNWRGDRDVRDWPEVLESGSPMSWVEGVPD